MKTVTLTGSLFAAMPRVVTRGAVTYALAVALACKSTEQPAPAPPGTEIDNSASVSQMGKPAPPSPFDSDTFPDVNAMPNLDPAVLKSSDPREVMKMAQAYAASDKPAEQAVLQDAFKDPTFYSRLDDEEALKQQAIRWRLASVMQVLRTNPAPAVQATILSLCDNATFVANSGRTELLIRVLVPIRPSPPKAVEFWREQGVLGHLHQHRVPYALADNGSVPAIALLEEEFLQADRPDNYKVAWMRDQVIRHRFELPMIQAAERLQKQLPQHLAVSLTEVYFIYKDRWYLSCEPPKPQPLSAASPEARRHYLAIADYALQSLPLDPLLREQIEATRRVLYEEQKHLKP